jgi:hypothetical protein
MSLFLLIGVIDGVDVAAGVEVATNLAAEYEFDSVDLQFSRSSLLSISHRLFAPAFHLSNTLLRFYSSMIQSPTSILECCNQAIHGGSGF